MACNISYFKPQHEISNNVVCVTSKGPDHPAHTHSLVRVFASPLNIELLTEQHLEFLSLKGGCTGVRLYKRCRNLPAGHCVTCSDAGCLSSIGTYLPGTVLQGCRLFKQCWSLPARHCVAGVQTISAMSEPTCRAL